MVQVLVVDDDARILRLLVRAAERMGMKATCASSLSEAKVLLGATLPDLVVTDYMLGDGDGVELMRFARALGIAAPALLVSATPPPAHQTNELFADVLAKPFHLDTLLDALYVLKGSLRQRSLSAKRPRHIEAAETRGDESETIRTNEPYEEEHTDIRSLGPAKKPRSGLKNSKPTIMARIIPKKKKVRKKR